MAGKLLAFRRADDLGELSDHGLAAACAAGDAAAQALVFARHAPAVHRFLARMVSASPADVDDLLQQAFLAAFASIGGFRGERLASWLYGVAANTARGHFRREAARRRLHAAVGDALADADDARAEARGDLPRLRAAIAALPTKYREVIALVDLEGERPIDVAHVLGVSESCVFARLARARARLRAALGGAP